VTDNKQSN